MLGKPSQGLPLVTVDSCLGGGKGPAGPCFYFHKTENSTLPGHQVKIAWCPSGAPGTRNDYIAKSSQVEKGCVFPLFAGPQMLRASNFSMAPRQTVQQRERKLPGRCALFWREKRHCYKQGSGFVSRRVEYRRAATSAAPTTQEPLSAFCST